MADLTSKHLVSNPPVGACRAEVADTDDEYASNGMNSGARGDYESEFSFWTSAGLDREMSLLCHWREGIEKSMYTPQKLAPGDSRGHRQLQEGC